jgi:hypothetical protein
LNSELLTQIMRQLHINNQGTSQEVWRWADQLEWLQCIVNGDDHNKEND